MVNFVELMNNRDIYFEIMKYVGTMQDHNLYYDFMTPGRQGYWSSPLWVRLGERLHRYAHVAGRSDGTNRRLFAEDVDVVATPSIKRAK